MRNILAIAGVFALGAGIGFTLSKVSDTHAASSPAYLIVSSDRKSGVTTEDYAAYLAAAGPLAAEAGLSLLAQAQQPTVFEGEWPYQTLAVERFDSLQALNEFWYSQDYQNAINLRKDLSTVNFIVAVEGL